MGLQQDDGGLFSNLGHRDGVAGFDCVGASSCFEVVRLSKGIPLNFEKLVQIALPRKMKALRQSIRKPLVLKSFSIEGKGVAAILKELNEPKDFSGCYVLVKSRKPFYVGISRKVITRLRQHIQGNTHFAASLAYRMAKDASQHRHKNRTRSQAMGHRGFNKDFRNAKEKLKSAAVAYVKIDNAEERYLFEIYAAIKLKTLKWNTFETH